MFTRAQLIPFLCFCLVAVCSAISYGQQKELKVVVGSVALPDGTPAENADVHLLRRSSGSYTLPVKTTKVVTDEKGTFEFRDVSPGKYKVWAETPRFTSLKKKLGGLELTVTKDEDEISLETLKMHEGCRYLVRIVSAETGKPLAGGRVIFGWTDLPREYHGNEEGIVDIGGLGVDDWYFVVSATGHGIEFKKVPKQSLGSTTELEFKLKPGGRLEGVVQDEAGKPVAGARVYASGTTGGMTPNYGRATTGEDGTFEFRNLPAGVQIRVSASKDEHERVSENIAIGAGQVSSSIKLLCKRRPYGGDCIVTVVDEDQNPISEALIQNTGSSSSLTREATTDKAGKALLANMYKSYRGLRVFARAKGYITQEFTVEAGTKEDPSTFKVVMQKGVTLKGRLVDPEGKPAAKIRVYYNEGEHPWTVGGRVTTDDQGHFDIEGLPEASTLTIYTPKKYAPINDMKVTAGQAERITFEMKLAGVLRIRAIDSETKKPIEEFNVKVANSRQRDANDPWGSFSTAFSRQGVNVMGEQKTFEMTHLMPGTPLLVTVSAKGYESFSQDRMMTESSNKAKVIDIALKRDDPENYESIAGKIETSDGKPVVGAMVRLIVGKESPISEANKLQGGRPDVWRNYNWYLVMSDHIDRSPNCLQVLTTATNTQGNFKFQQVQKKGEWLELIHTGGGMAPARHPDLRNGDQSLQAVQLTAKKPSSMRLFVDKDKYPDAQSIQLDVPYSSQYPDCLKMAFNSKTINIDEKTREVHFKDLPAGNYRVSIQKKPTPVGNNGFRTETIGSYTVELPVGEDMEGEL